MHTISEGVFLLAYVRSVSRQAQSSSSSLIGQKLIFGNGYISEMLS